jgi:thioredoxin 2
MRPSHILACGRCGQKNRIAADRPLREARCGQCRAPLFAGAPVEIDEAALSRHLETDTLPVLVDVWAPWCGPCRTMSPAFAAAAGVLEPNLRLFKLDADAAPELSRRFSIRSIPTLLLFHRGALVARSAGAMDTRQIVAWARQHLAGTAAG